MLQSMASESVILSPLSYLVSCVQLASLERMSKVCYRPSSNKTTRQTKLNDLRIIIWLR